MATFSIKDVADFSGVKPHTIRIWEQRYSFLQPQRTPGLQRTYTSEELGILLNVVLLNRSGYKISRIDRMTTQEKAQIASKIAWQHQKAVHELIICMAKMDAEGFETLLDSCVISCGIHETILQILLPFCDRIGLLQEEYPRNYMENIIIIKQSVKQKLHLGIEKSTPADRTNKKVMLFLTAGEQQELPLLCLQYLLKVNGFETLYLGQYLSIESLEMINKHAEPHYLVTFLAKKANRPALITFVEKLPELSPQTKFISIADNLSLNGGSQHYEHAPTFSDGLEIITKDNTIA